VRVARDLAIAAACPPVLRKRTAIWCVGARSLRVQALWIATGGNINVFGRGPYYGVPAA
jgi:hypothetical protein